MSHQIRYEESEEEIAWARVRARAARQPLVVRSVQHIRTVLRLVTSLSKATAKTKAPRVATYQPHDSSADAKPKVPGTRSGSRLGWCRGLL
jgi:hypothetical protein